MHFSGFLTRCGLLVLAAVPAARTQVTDPRITSWQTAKSAQYARVWETATDKSSNNAVSTWPRSGLTNGGGGVSTATYSDVQRVAYSTTYVYIQTTGLASYTMGNWLTPNGQTYTSWPANRAAIHRIPRTPSIPATKQKNNGSGGVLVNGVYLWQNGDAQSYINASSTATSATIAMNGDGIWNRLAGAAETFNFDTANGHQPSNGAYHNHINPKALRSQLGDNVTYNASTKTYSEAGTPTKHSPIIGWANDGLPIYGPYGYATAMDASSGIRRMTSGFVKRNAANVTAYGTDDLAVTGRIKLPVWAASVQGRSQTLTSTQYGPTTTATYAQGPTSVTCVIGTFAEDYEYLGDLGKTQGVDFDLNRQNVRFCVTPEFPSGTYAYFTCIDASGNTVFPDVINLEYFGTVPAGQGVVTSITESVTEYADAGPAAAITVSAVTSGTGVALSWNSAEGATYKVESSPDNATWATLSSTVTSGGLTTSYTATASANYFRVTLTAIATYDTGGTYGTAVGKTGTVLYDTAATAPSITTQPTNVTVTAGAAASFTVVASGTATLSYQWKKGGTNISGATNATYTLASTVTGDAGSYTVTVTNSAGSVTSSAATLTVNAAATAPAITTQPASVTVTAGASASFSVVATGTAPLTYQWSKGGTTLSGATNATYALASTVAGDAGNYTVTVTNSAGTVTSTAASLTVNTATSAPTITTQPASQTVTAGASVSFTVAASSSVPLTYQWSKGGATIAGATSATYTIATTTAGDAGTYAVAVTNSAGTVTSTGANLTVNAAPTAPAITAQPASQVVTAGASVSFTVAASGTTPLTYLWSKGGAAIAGATAATYTLATTTTADTGSYTVTVTNSVGSVTSAAATLTVNAAVTPPSITTAPTAQSVVAGSSATFSVTAAGTAPLSYQWSKGAAAITGATSATFTIAGAQSGDAGNYAVTVTNAAGTVTSAAVALSVSAAPVAPSIVAQPASQTVTAGASVTFSVGAGGTAPLTYQWSKAGAAIAGATNATLVLSAVQSGDAGSYAVTVTNALGTATSDAATLTVNAAVVAPSIVTHPVNVTVVAGAAASFTVVATGTAPLTYQWSKGGVALTGATAAVLTLASAQSSDAGLYYCVVTNAAGAVTSNSASLGVTAAPVAPTITAAPAGVAAQVGNNVAFAVVVTGTAPFTYQWSKGGAAIAGATAANLALSNVQTADAGDYAVAITNAAGTVTSAAATLTVTASAVAPTITTQPVNQTVTAGSAVSLTVAASGTAPFTYAWRRNGATVAGATAATLALTNVQAADAGSYTVVVTNTVGAVTSSAATLTVNPAPTAPVITQSPGNLAVVTGASATFAVVASGTAPLTYQWRKNGTPLAGATDVAYTVVSAQAGDAGSYSVVVTNSVGTATSPAATLTVTAAAVAPTIVTAPAAVTTTTGGTATFAVVAGGTAPFAYQWRKAGVAIAGATAATLVIAPVQTADAGSYAVTVTNSAGAVTSAPATLTVSAVAVAPTIVTPPVSLTVTVGDSATLSVVGAGTAPLTYQWLKNGAAIPGATVATYALGNVQAAAAGSYAVIVANSVGAVSSAAAVLTVTPTTSPPVTPPVAVPAARIVNLSARTAVGGLAGAPITGFVLRGTGTKRMLVRAVGPTLRSFGLSAALADPVLQLVTGSTTVAANDNWADADAPTMAATGAFALVAGGADAALVSALPPGGYTAPVAAKGADSGVVLVELYDAGTAADALAVVNASTRAYVGTGDAVLIPGFVISGTGTLRLLIRAVGPTLGALGVAGALVDPKLTLYRGDTVLASNDDWANALNASEVSATAAAVGAFALPNGSRDAALVTTLPAGAYSVVVNGVGETTGTALVEFYVVP